MKAYNTFKEKIYGEKWNYGEDEIWSILVNKYARSKICIGKTIYIYNINKFSLINNKNNNIVFTKNIINWIEILKIILFYYEKIYLNRLNFFIKIIEKNKLFRENIRNNRKIKNKYYNIFRNITFQFNINNKTMKNINI